jgi:hypothetical protein
MNPAIISTAANTRKIFGLAFETIKVPPEPENVSLGEQEVRHPSLKAVRDIALSDPWEERGVPPALRPKFTWSIRVERALLPAVFEVDLAFRLLSRS